MSEWIEVRSSSTKATTTTTTTEQEQEPRSLTKQQIKNKKRSERRRERSTSIGSKTEEVEREASPGVVVLPRIGALSGDLSAQSGCAAAPSDDDDEAGTTECWSSGEELDSLRELERRFRRLSKTLKQIEAAEEKVRAGLCAADSQLLAKIQRRESVGAELESVRQMVAQVEDKRCARATARAAASAELARAREAEALLILSVRFDEKVACPICTEVIEAAVSVPSVCAHVFCRACLEDHVAKADKPAECVCPLCRAPLCDPTTLRVEARPAYQARARLKYLNGTCHCGLSLPLNKLRDHLRSCGPKASLFAPRRKFGHEFKQPRFVGANNGHNNQQHVSRRIDYEREERLQLQAALLASVHDR